MMAALRRLRAEVEDGLRYDPAVRELLAAYHLAHDRFARPRTNQDVAWCLHRIASAGRLACRPDTLDAVYRAVHRRLDQLDVRAVDWLELDPASAPKLMHKSLILKPPLGPNEKGVMYHSFEREWPKVLFHADPAEVARDWVLVLAPSSSPHNVANYVFPRGYPGTVVTQISNASDLDELPRISDRLHVVPLYASSWVRPEAFQPRPRSERDIDLLMVANFAKFKRHYALFQAMRYLPRSWRIHLIGQAQDGRTAETTNALADTYGVADRFTVQSNAKYAEVAEAFGRAKVSVILSKREGSCVVVAESLFADTPVAVLAGAQLGSRSFVNDRTGVLLQEGNLAGQLMDFHAAADGFSARAWAEENISCHRSSRTLNDYLKNLALARGEEWTRDVAPMCWRPDPRHVHAADRAWVEPARQAFKARWGLEVGPDE